MKFRALLAAAAFALAAAPSASPTYAADYTMKVGFATMNDIQHQWGTWFKEAIEARTGGKIEVKLFPRNQLGTTASQLEGLQLGTVEAVVTPADFLSGIDPRFGVFSIPVLFKSPAQAEKVLLDPAINKEILGIGADKGIQVVTITTFGMSHYFGKQPLRKLDDFKGKKLRVNATPAERAKMRQFGASAVPMDLSEVIPGLQQGVIDGTQSVTPVYVNLKFIDLGKTLTQVNDTMIISVAAVSRAFLNKLPADLRQAVIEEGAKLQPRLMEKSREMDAEMRKRWTDAGGEFVSLSPEDQARVMQLLGGVGEEVTKDNAAVNAFYKRVLAVSQKNN
jgi:C4-dicarboxylate-binding protein DctP